MQIFRSFVRLPFDTPSNSYAGIICSRIQMKRNDVAGRLFSMCLHLLNNKNGFHFFLDTFIKWNPFKLNSIADCCAANFPMPAPKRRFRCCCFALEKNQMKRNGNVNTKERERERGHAVIGRVRRARDEKQTNELDYTLN